MPASTTPIRQPLGQHPLEKSGLRLPKPEAQGSELQKPPGHARREEVLCEGCLPPQVAPRRPSYEHGPLIRSEERTPELSGSAAQQVSGG